MTDPHRYLAAQRPLTIRLGLERMERALAALGSPERALRVLHVAGTNGKGSTCAMAAQALREAGLRVGLYTSPHLVRFNERIAVDGVAIEDGALAARLDEVRRACPWQDAGPEEERLTYFELATLVALRHFEAEGVAVAVLEVGLGGRFDATNAVRPLACAVTRIGIDHAELLGDTLEAIAREKAGIFKAGVPAATTAAQPAEALAVLRQEAARVRAPLELAPAGYAGEVALAGEHQRANAALASAALRLLRLGGVAVSDQAIAHGIARTRWPGRLETVAGVLLDGAHNPDGAAALAAALPVLHPGRPVELVFGVLADKDHASMLRALSPAARGLHLVAPPTPRARPPSSYEEEARSLFSRIDVHDDVASAVTCARQAASTGTGGGPCASPGRSTSWARPGSCWARPSFASRTHTPRQCERRRHGPPVNARAIVTRSSRSPSMRTLTLLLAATLTSTVLATGAAATPAASQNVVTSVEVHERGGQIVVAIAGTQPPSFTTFALSDPPRFVIDLAGAALRGVPEEQAPGGVVAGVQALELTEQRAQVARVIVTFAAEVEPPELVAAGNVLEVRVAKPAGTTVAAAGPAAAAQVARVGAVTDAAPKEAVAASTSRTEPAAVAKPGPRAQVARVAKPVGGAAGKAAPRPALAVKAGVPRRSAAPPARTPAPTQELRELGFRSTPDGSRVFVRTSAVPRFTIAQAGERGVLVELPDTLIRNPNHARPLDTRFFPGAVAAVSPSRRGRTTVLTISLKEQVAYSQRVDGDTLSIDFALPGAAGSAEAAEPAEPPTPAP